GLSCSKQVNRWVERGALDGKRGIGAGRHRQMVVTEDALFSFMERRAYWHEWDPARIPDPVLREWAEEVRGGERYLLQSEVADRYCVSVRAVGAWIQRGQIQAVRLGGGGNHLIPASALDGFVP